MNVYVVKAFRGNTLKHIAYIQALSPQLALCEFKGNLDLEELDHLYFNVRQVD